VEKTLVSGEVVERLLYKDPATRKTCRGIEDNPFYARQDRRVLRECGFLDPEDIREFMLHGGYSAAKKAFRRNVARGDLQADQRVGPARPRRRRFPHRAQVGSGAGAERRRRSTSSATATKAIRARS
jgi:hypothetical protein